MKYFPTHRTNETEGRRQSRGWRREAETERQTGEKWFYTLVHIIRTSKPQGKS